MPGCCVVQRRPGNGAYVDTPVRPEAPIFDRDEGIDEMGRHLAQAQPVRPTPGR